MIKKFIIHSVYFFSLLYVPVNIFADIIPYGNGAWVYDATYNDKGGKGPLIPGLFKNSISTYNLEYSKTNESKISQIFVYGGDIEVENKSNPNQSNIYYYPDNVNKSHSWQNLFYDIKSKEVSGFASAQSYQPKEQFLYGKNQAPLVVDKTGIDGVKYKILVIDGRVDSGGYLQELNSMNETQARGLARKVAGFLCADNSIDGVQFDIEPFSFTGKGGKPGSGQKYFYQEIAKCFAGWYSKDYSKISSINKYGKDYDSKSDLINAVNQKHPFGRFFSVFTFADSISPEVTDIYNKFGNFYIIDSLYDLSNTPAAAEPTSTVKYEKLVQGEVAKMKSKKIPYQFAIPAAASCHEFKSCDGKLNNNIVSQLDYVKIALNQINPKNLRTRDKYFKGIAIWSWNSQMWWNRHKLEPSKPDKKTLKYLGTQL